MNNIQQHDWHGIPVFTLENDYLSATLCPSLGNNLFRIRDKVKQRELLRVPENPTALRNEPIQYGTPILLPPNRIRNGRFEFNGTRYQFETNPDTGQHIHGIVKNLPWDVKQIRADHEHCSIVCSLHFADFPQVLSQFPHDLRMELTYELTGKTVVQKFTAGNHSQTAAPFGFGLHTWFMLDGAPERWTVQVPVEGRWETGPDLMPTERVVPLGEYADLPNGMNLHNVNIDAGFRIGDHPALAVLSSEDCELRYQASNDYKHWVVYTKGVADQFICLEPYTWISNAPNLSLPHSVSGFQSIKPGESVNLEVSLEVVHK